MQQCCPLQHQTTCCRQQSCAKCCTMASFRCPIFAPLKKGKGYIIKAWKIETRASHISKESFTGLISKVLDAALL